MEGKRGESGPPPIVPETLSIAWAGARGSGIQRQQLASEGNTWLECFPGLRQSRKVFSDFRSMFSVYGDHRKKRSAMSSDSGKVIVARPFRRIVETVNDKGVMFDKYHNASTCSCKPGKCWEFESGGKVDKRLPLRWGHRGSEGWLAASDLMVCGSAVKKNVSKLRAAGVGFKEELRKREFVP
ncbi:hypothetical protein E2C01_035767 [Portunus trituberculatus]|uniref:Uncharacterized protein n=1 Tax=Portunus trituberculatus TaxID=210409 RepID=A0A5B7F6T3_PORTR|nr:hypothetical protein [Portunus trituberculatus]